MEELSISAYLDVQPHSAKRTARVRTWLVPVLSLQMCVIQLLSGASRNAAGHSGRKVYCTNSLCPLQHWDRGFESHSMHGCLSAFILSYV
jgi:hypothetical protein